jgi:hypothetical protein
VLQQAGLSAVICILCESRRYLLGFFIPSFVSVRWLLLLTPADVHQAAAADAV